MNYNLAIATDSLSIALTGSFTFTDATRFCHIVLKAVLENARKEVRLDLSGIHAADTSALNLLMQFHDLAKKQHRVLIFEKPQGFLSKMLLEASRFNPLNIAA